MKSEHRLCNDSTQSDSNIISDPLTKETTHVDVLEGPWEVLREARLVEEHLRLRRDQHNETVSL